LVSTSIFAEDDKQKLATEYLELSKTKQTFDATIQAYVDQIAASNPNASKDQIRHNLNSLMGWDVLKQPTIKIVMKHLTSDELKQINAFYKTKEGKSYAEKSPAIAIDISNLIGENMQKALKQRQQ
jgi:hypothetical protein